jgi:CubicO group peptidase (beta-lactamase class C family)
MKTVLSLAANALFSALLVTAALQSAAASDGIAQSKARIPTAQQQISLLQQRLLPPVIVRGEKTNTKTLLARMAELHVPGVSVAVIRDGKIAWAHGFGVTRIGGPPVTADTIFQAASISKPVTAFGVMRLVQGKKLDLDVDVNQYLKSWKVPVNDYTQQRAVTLRELLTHSAGVTVHGFAGYDAGAPLPTLTQVLDGAPPANNPPIRVDIPVGKTFRYSGGGYEIAQEVITDVTGMGFSDFMEQFVLSPLKMTHSTYQQPLDARLLPKAATPYRADGTPVKNGPHVYPEQAAAGLWTTPSDLARFAIGVQDAWSAKSNSVLSLTAAHLMLRPEIQTQAIGLGIGGTAPNVYFTHGGANEGYRCELLAYEAGVGIVVMTNGDRGGELVNEVVRTVAQDNAWPDFLPVERSQAAIDPKLFDRYVGAYRLPTGDIVTFWRQGTRLKDRIWGRSSSELFASSDREFFLKTANARWIFGSTDGQAKSATLYQNNTQYIATRLEEPAATEALQASIEADNRFQNQTADPRSESVLRNFIEGVRIGKPNYEAMNPSVSLVTHDELSTLQKTFTGFGAFQSISLKRVEPSGLDVYAVQFANGTHEFRLLLNAKGQMDDIGFDP